MDNWLLRGINYQVNLRAVAAREPRNPVEAAREKPPAGSALAYLAQHVQAIKKLGFTILHVMPPFLIGVEGRKGIGSPYAIRDYDQIDPEFGTLEELQAVVRRAHALGLKVILGMVPNHTSRDHRWIQEHPEYYVRDAQGAAAFDCDWSDTAKLDYTQPALRRAMLETYDRWLGILGRGASGAPDGVDGFRVDMAHFINDRSFWNEALPELRRRHAGRELLFLAECYGRDNSMDLFARGFNASYDDAFYKVCDHFYGVTPDGGSVVLRPEQMADHVRQSQAFAEYQQGGIAAVFGGLLAQYEQDLQPAGNTLFYARYTDNHDEGRGIYRFGAGAVQAAMQVAFLSAHSIPFLLAGQEFGAGNRPSIHERLRPCDKGRRVVAGARAVWQEGVEFEGNLFARGFTERQRLYAFYRGLIRLRLKHAALRAGTFQLMDAGEAGAGMDRTVLAFERRLGRARLRCAVNLGPTPRALGRADLLRNQPLWGGLEGDGLPPFGAVVCRA